MSDDIEATRRRAEEDYRRNQQVQMATEQEARTNDELIARNAEIARQRQLDEERRRNQG